ncbi:ATP-binding protein [Daejeonella sp.]|uniref:ATP-binding protein n=1 Tax=Daejeonella sp. TaxID=2805397 RepID=UPI00398341E2
MENSFGMNIIPENDIRRIEALRRYQILNSPPEHAFDNVAKLATQIFGVPISLISLVDANKVFFKANIGMGDEIVEDRGDSLCSLAVMNTEVTVFENAPDEPCLMANPNVAGSLGLKFYAGAPLTTHDGFHIGTVCVIDKETRSFSEKEKVILEGLAKIVMDEIELRLSSIQKVSEQNAMNEELAAMNEEVQASNEELVSSNFQLADMQRELERTLATVTESEGRLKYLLNDAPVAIAVLKGRELIIDSANMRALDIWGKNSDIIGKPLHIALPELQGQQFLNWIDDVYTTGVPYEGREVKAQLERNGKMEDVYSNFVYHPIRDQDGDVNSIMLVATVITDEVNAKFQLKESEQNLKLLADNMSQLAWMTDENGYIFWYNQRWYDYTGTTLEEMKGSGWKKVHHPDEVERVARKFENDLNSGRKWEDTFPLRRADGEYRWFLSKAVPLKNDEGKIVRWIGTNTDVTEEMKLAQQKDDFISIASHELKTPIASLKASVQMMHRIKNDASSPLFPKLIDQSNRSIEKMTSLIENLLNVDRMREGQLRLSKSMFCINDLLDSCCNHVRMGKKYELIIEGDTALQIFADEHRIEQVVVNFVNNAVKYAPNSEMIKITISKVNGHAKISVKDFGMGIPKEQQPHLFDRYWRADHSGAQYSGLGLGLYICAEIVKRHGGQIGVDSVSGVGSEFWFTIPLEQ